MKQKEIILVPFPFSDQSSRKVRPALIVSNDAFNRSSEDVIVCAITRSASHGTLPLYGEHLEEQKIVDRCFIKPESLAKIHKRLILKKLDCLKEKPFLDVKKRLYSLF